MMQLLNLIRFKNLLMIAFVQIIGKYVLFDAFGVFTALNTMQFSALVLATVCIAGAGYTINNLQDLQTDLINKPEKVVVKKHISENTAYNVYFALTIIGALLGLYVSNAIGKNAFFAIFVLSAGLLYMYSNTFKPMTLVGNIIVSLLVAFSILIVGVFDLSPVITEQNKSFQLNMFSVLADYAIFAFIINFIREIVKDIEDTNGDYKLGMKTLPIVLGQSRTAKICFALCVVAIMLVMYYISTYFYRLTFVILYMLALVVAPLIYCAIKLFSAKQKAEFSQISMVLKVVMFTGICSMFLFQFIMN